MMRFLLIDTGVLITCLVQLALLSTDTVLEHVNTGEEALARAKYTRYDAAFMDLVIPDMDGYDLIGQLRETSHTMKIFVVSSFERSEAKAKAILLGANVFLAQPVDEAELMVQVRALIVK